MRSLIFNAPHLELDNGSGLEPPGGRGLSPGGAGWLAGLDGGEVRVVR